MAGDAPDVRDRRRELMHRLLVERGLSEHGLVEHGLSEHRLSEAPETAVLRAGERYPLSAGQRRMWFQQTLDGADPTLNVGVGYRLTGPVDPARLRRAFDDVVARHHILRTGYGVDETGEPYQVFDNEAKALWQQHDSIGSDPKTLIEAEFGRPFDLTCEPPLRVSLIRTGAEQFLLTLVVHHICWDDDCWAVFFDELSRAYRGDMLTGPAPQYLAALDRSAVPTPADVAHWRAALHPLPEPVRLPGRAGEPASRRAAHHSRALPVELFATVEAFARTHATSPFTVLLAAFGAVIGRYTETPDLLVAVPVTDRPAGAEQTLGYFGNTLLLRLIGHAGSTFASSVDAARETALTGFAHACVGIDRVVSELNPTRAPGRAGLDDLVQLGFSMRKDAGGFVFDGGAVEQLDLGAATAPVPLALAIVTDSRGVTAEFEYQADVLDGALVERLAEHYLRLLDHALREPDSPLATLEMLGMGERAAILAASHGRPAEISGTTMIAALEAAAAARPDATALAADDGALTYAELHRRSNRLARRLIAQGVGPEDVVGLRLATSVEFVVAMLAVLKAGAAYLPIDPGYPAERIDYLIADTAPVLVLDPAGFDAAERAAAECSAAAVSDADRLRPLRPDNLAYVIYTSGSTGVPKGVTVSHAAIAEHIAAFAADWTVTAEDRLLQAASVSFDASAAEIFLTLALGATLVIPKPGALSDIDYLVGLLERHRVTVLQMVPSVLGTLLQLPDHPVWQRLRHLPVGGEALPGPVADAFTARYPAVELRNHYGPTEAVVCATHQPVDRRYGTAVVPIGVPNRNVDAYVLDAALQLVPTGVVGELYLGGTQLARGYLRRPGQTAQRFVADPFHPGRRLYRTGDLVRRNDTGELEFVGRADEQVKIRGFRVELGEIEAVLAAHPAVRDCRVVVDTTGEPTLVAYLVPDEIGCDIAAVIPAARAHAAARLPGYMVPGAFAVLDELPLTVAGKLDRRALPSVTAAPAGVSRKPVTPTENRVCGIFAGLFDRAQVGADDSFFTLGGHSLLAARLVAQLRAEFGVELPIRTVFDTPTPAGLAAGLVEQFRTEFDVDLDDLGDSDGADEYGRVDTPRPVLSPAARPERIPLSYSQLVGWFQYRIEGDREAFAMPLTLRIDGPLDTVALSAALNDVMARHEALRSTFGEQDGVPHQRVHPPQPVPLRVRPVSASGVEDAVAGLRREPLDPRTGPLLRAELLSVDPVTHTLAVIVHHLVCDHGSLQVIVDDLIAAYGARLAGADPQLPALALQFADYAIWQRSVFDTPDPWGRAELDFRRAVLAGLPDEVTIPPDRPRRAVLGQRGEIVEFTIAAAERAALIALAETAGATEFMVYQAISAVWLHALGAGTDIAIGSPAAARVEPGTENLVGLLANAVVLRTDLTGDPTLREVLARSRDCVLDAFTHQEVPIERLVDAVKPARSGFRNPLYQNMIHFRGPDWSAEPRALAPGTTLTGVPVEFTASLMDIDLGMTVTTAGELGVRVVANADLYDPATVTHLADALRAAFSAFAAAPEQTVSTLRLLPDDALARVLAEPAHITAAMVAAADPTAAEGLLIRLLEELLETTDIDGDDNFFAVGGDSITSIKWAAAAAGHGITMTPAMVFEHATIRELAAAVAGAGSAAADRSYQPMSVSGLDAASLTQLTAAWGDRR